MTNVVDDWGLRSYGLARHRPLVQMYYSWSELAANLLFTGAAICSLVTFLIMGAVSRRISDQSFVSFSLVLGCSGFALLLGKMSEPPSAARFLVAFALISTAFPLGRASVKSLYTKALPLESQGSGQGVLLAVGAIARILGPFVGVAVFSSDNGGYLIFGGCALLFALAFAFVIASYGAITATLQSRYKQRQNNFVHNNNDVNTTASTLS